VTRPRQGTARRTIVTTTSAGSTVTHGSGAGRSSSCVHRLSAIWPPQLSVEAAGVLSNLEAELAKLSEEVGVIEVVVARHDVAWPRPDGVGERYGEHGFVDAAVMDAVAGAIGWMPRHVPKVSTKVDFLRMGLDARDGPEALRDRVDGLAAMAP